VLAAVVLNELLGHERHVLRRQVSADHLGKRHVGERRYPVLGKRGGCGWRHLVPTVHLESLSLLRCARVPARERFFN
jgi:hypothetical protein